jgi:G:T-mismatch repair DNA endonuclease (very short patch repair protein)
MKKRSCPYCAQILNGGSRHIFFCGLKIDPNKSKEIIKKEFLEHNFPNISKKEILISEYHIRLKSLPDLKKQYGIDFKSLLFLLDFYKIHKRTTSESAIKISQKKYKKTCKKKYGVENVSQLDNVKLKKAQTFLENYGVDNIWKSEEFKTWLKKHMKDTYGVGSLPNNKGNADSWGWNKLTILEKEERLKTLFSNFESSIEKIIHNILTDINIGFTTHFFVDNLSYDIRIEQTKKLIEIQGDYWHANPNKFKENDLIANKKLGNVTAKEIWDKDYDKKQRAEKLGYSILYIWESDIKMKNESELKIQILDFLLN